MNLLGFITIVWYVLAVAIFVVCGVVIWARRNLGAVWPFCWKFFLGATLLLPLHWLVIAPPALAWLVAGRIGTRSFERDYPGPTVDGLLIPPVQFSTADGVSVQGYYLPRDDSVPSANCGFVVTHGLFRNALEIEPVGEMLRGLGVDVLLLELRNHGGSDRATPTFGRDESLDVAAGVRWLRREHGIDKVGAFGVSLGGISVALASHLVELDAIVIDAPIASPAETARQTLTGSRRVQCPEFLVDRIVGALENQLGVRLADVRPLDTLRGLAPEVPVHLFGGSEDHRVPIQALHDYFDALPTAPSQKSMWIGEGARHGKVWIEYPDDYRIQLRNLLARMH